MPLVGMLAGPIIGKVLDGIGGEDKKDKKEEGPGKLLEMFANVLNMGGDKGGGGEGIGKIFSAIC